MPPRKSLVTPTMESFENLIDNTSPEAKGLTSLPNTQYNPRYASKLEACATPGRSKFRKPIWTT